MQLRTLLFLILIQTTSAFAQIITFPYSENFDGVLSPGFPPGWSADGFSVSTSTVQSSPNCVSVIGNTTIKQLTSQVISFTNKIPDKLIYYERRSNTAVGYRLELRASIDGSNFNVLLARFDTISTTINYVQRVVSLVEAGLQQQTNVRIRWQLLGDNTNATGVLRIDDVTITVSNGFDDENVKGNVLINEIMYYPVGDEPEWVELNNTSPDTINIKNWRISDSNISTKSIITQADVLIPPNSYLVIAKDIVFASYHSGVPVVVANFSALNNATPDAVVIYDTRLNTIDSVMYAPSWGGQYGKSLERIDVEMPSTSLTNWGTSQDTLGSTPGRKNSIGRSDYDLMISNLTQTQTMVGGKVVPVINVGVQNIGRRAMDSVLVCFYSNRNRNAVPEPSELLCTTLSVQSLVAGDSILFSESFPQLVSGVNNFIIIADSWRDENLRNNRSSISVKISYEPRSLVINEIMYDPLYGQNEWFELYNRSDQPIDLAHWNFNDKPTSSGVNSFEISNEPFVIEPGGYAIIVADSTLFQLFPNLSQSDSIIHNRILNRSSGFSFNNDGDVVVLKDMTGQTIDSVAYSPRWHHSDVVDTKGRSLERINPNIGSNDSRNWSTCTNILGGTPGKANSIAATSIKSNLIISISPNPFSPDGDGFEDFCIIRYNLPVMTSTLNLRIYDVKGRLVRTLANGELAGTQGEIVWDGIGDDKRHVRIGVYVIFLEATDRSSSKVMTAKAVAVVATKL